jgi:hypothetical protein
MRWASEPSLHACVMLSPCCQLPRVRQLTKRTIESMYWQDAMVSAQSQSKWMMRMERIASTLAGGMRGQQR